MIKNVFITEKSQETGIRVIIEGGFQNDWNRHHLDSGRFNIPQKTLKIEIPLKGYYFYPVKKLAGVYVWDDIVPDDSCNFDGEYVTGDYNTLFGIQRPATILVEDGRIFHDLGLLCGDNKKNSRRLISLIKALEERYGEDFFNLVYKELEEKRRERLKLEMGLSSASILDCVRLAFV